MCTCRTSSTLLVDQAVAEEQPWLAAPILPFQEAARRLAGQLACSLRRVEGSRCLNLLWAAGSGERQWGASGRLPAAGQRCFESAQLACYLKVCARMLSASELGADSAAGCRASSS